MPVDPWARRGARAGELARRWPAGEGALRLLDALAPRQGEVERRLADAARFEPERAAGEAAALLEVIATHAPAAAAARAAEWKALGATEIARRLEAFWAGARGDPLDDHLAKVLVQPYASALARSGGGACPFCATRPALSVLREDAEAGATARFLVCSVCFAERAVARILCPACGEDRPDKLPRLGAEEIPWIRIEACESCGRYVKSIELTREPQADPIADELGSVVLDAAALDRGWEKIEPNLAGV